MADFPEPGCYVNGLPVILEDEGVMEELVILWAVLYLLRQAMRRRKNRIGVKVSAGVTHHCDTKS